MAQARKQKGKQAFDASEDDYESSLTPLMDEQVQAKGEKETAKGPDGARGGLEGVVDSILGKAARVFGQDDRQQTYDPSKAYRSLSRAYRRAGLRPQKMTMTEDFPFSLAIVLGWPYEGSTVSAKGLLVPAPDANERLTAEAELIAHTADRVAAEYGLDPVYTAPTFVAGGGYAMYVGLRERSLLKEQPERKRKSRSKKA